MVLTSWLLRRREEGQMSESAFRSKILGNRSMIECYTKSFILKGHGGCVNSILFSDNGLNVITGSDDTRIKIFDFLNDGKEVASIPTLHTNNIFYAKDLPFSDGNRLVSCAADGRVVQTILSTGGSKEINRHIGRAHRLSLFPGCANEFFSCGEDGKCYLYDLRTTGANVLQLTFRDHENDVCAIYGTSINPTRPNELVIGGATTDAQLFDTRRPVSPVGFFSPQHLRTHEQRNDDDDNDFDNTGHHITGITFNYSGDEILATYNDEHVYTFDRSLHVRSTLASPAGASSASTSSSTVCSTSAAPAANDGDSFSREFSGHRNQQTVKQVSYLGSRSEFVVSGSDCGHIFVWESCSGSLVTVLQGDAVGAVNCLTPHPYLPVLATSGLEHDGKIWAPCGEHRPLLPGSEAAEAAEKLCARNENKRVTARRRSRRFRSPISPHLLAQLVTSGRMGEGEGGEIPSWQRQIFALFSYLNSRMDENENDDDDDDDDDDEEDEGEEEEEDDEEGDADDDAEDEDGIVGDDEREDGESVMETEDEYVEAGSVDGVGNRVD